MSTLVAELLESLGKNPSKVPITLPSTDKKRYGQDLSTLLLKSHRYHLSSKTAQNASSLGFSVKDIGQVMSLARPPFATTWLEWNLQDQFEPLGINTAPDAPKRVGGMVQSVEGGRLLLTSIMATDFGPLVSPVSILFDPDEPLNKTASKIAADREFLAKCMQPHLQLESEDTSRTIDGKTPTLEACYNIMDSCLVGGALVGNLIIDPNETFEMVHHASYILTPHWSGAILKGLVQTPEDRLQDTAVAISDIFHERIIESSGFARFLIGALALMNTSQHVERRTIKPTDKKPAPEPLNKRKAPIYEFVEMLAPHKIIITDVIEGQTQDHEPGPRKALHEVAAHFAHSRKIGRDDCSHDYEKRGPNSWVCLNCGKKRWHRKEHLRGDPALGVVEHKNRIVLS